MIDCIFCKIINKEIPSDIIFENEKLVVFKDINPKADIHLLIVPKKHIANLNEAVSEDSDILSELLLITKEIARQLNLLESGYKLVINVGRGGGQVIDHLHIHFLSGSFNRSLKEI